MPLRSVDSRDSAAAIAAVSASPVPAHSTAIHVPTNHRLESAFVPAPSSEPPATRTKPSATVTLAPSAFTSTLAGTAPTTIPPTSGSIRSPDPSTSVPCTAWKYCGMTNSSPIIPSPASPLSTAPQVNVRDSNSPGSTSGCPWCVDRRRSQEKNTASTTSPAAIRLRLIGCPHPCSPASTSP
ncbi:MAG: hypothetical protein AUG49_07205 [Catenulispora sp. 13_1_20CM_3_70_7]|nr:MAG: hypothetical protein AUG49_07205 [Catenulispora sp. 13_1_20CM_3_70_7]